MDIVTLAIVFLLISLLMIVPLIAITKISDKFKKQHMDFRINTIHKQTNLLSNGNKSQLKKIKLHTPKSSLSVGKIFFFIFLPVPPILVMLLSESLYSAISSILIYFISIAVFYFLINKVKSSRYKKAFIAELPNSVDLIIRSLRAGRTITDSIKTVGDETKGLVAEQLRNIVDQVELGKNFVSVVNDVSRRLNIAEFTFFVIVLSVQQESGGNSIKTLSSLANMLRQRQLMRLKVKALSSEGIFSAFFMGGLPIFVGGLIVLLRPEYIMLLFTSKTGQNMLIAGIISEIIGCYFIARMVQIDI